MSEKLDFSTGVITSEREPDRITVSVGRKVTDGNYGSYNAHCTLATSVQHDESLTATTKRALNFCRKVVKHEISSAVKADHD